MRCRTRAGLGREQWRLHSGTRRVDDGFQVSRRGHGRLQTGSRQVPDGIQVADGFQLSSRRVPDGFRTCSGRVPGGVQASSRRLMADGFHAGSRRVPDRQVSRPVSFTQLTMPSTLAFYVLISHSAVNYIISSLSLFHSCSVYTMKHQIHIVFTLP